CCLRFRHPLHPLPSRRSSDLPSVYLSIVSVSSPFSFRYKAFAMLSAPFIDQRILLFFIRKVIAVQFWFSCTPMSLYTIPGYPLTDRKSTRLNSSHVSISYAVF